jgi:hypothetical protein
LDRKRSTIFGSSDHAFAELIVSLAELIAHPFGRKVCNHTPTRAGLARWSG